MGERFVATPALRARLREQGRQGVWLAGQINVSKGHFSHVLAGRRAVDATDARLVAALLGIDFFVLWKVSEGDEISLNDTNDLTVLEPLEVAS